MKAKFIQINIYKGKFFEELLNFLKAEDADFIAIQEVSVGKLNNYKDKSADLFKLLCDELGMYGVHEPGFRLSDEEGSMGNAVFSKYKIKNSYPLRLKEYKEVTYARSQQRSFFPNTPRILLDALCDLGEKQVHVMSWHGAWTAPPEDTGETIRQAELIADYLKRIGPESFILGADTNNLIGSKTIKIVSKISNNLLENSDLEGTLNTKVHYNAPHNYLIDLVFTSANIQKLSIKVPKITVSDHLPVVCELEI